MLTSGAGWLNYSPPNNWIDKIVMWFKRWLKRTPLYTAARAVRDLFRTKSKTEKIDRGDTRYTAQILRNLLRPADNCIDVGAHAGDVLAVFVRRCPSGRHIAIEPIPHLADALRTKFAGVEVHHAAVGDSSGMVEFNHVVSSPAFSGIERRPDLSPDAEIRRMTVALVRLDDVIPDDRQVRLIKVDVEGGELGVFRGGARVLARCRPWVLFEHGSAAAGYGTTSAAVFDELVGHRLVIWKLSDWLAGRSPLSREDFIIAVGSGEYWNFLAGPG